ncbi:MAG: hypothetical protein ABH811_00015 [archaeon]
MRGLIKIVCSGSAYTLITLGVIFYNPSPFYGQSITGTTTREEKKVKLPLWLTKFYKNATEVDRDPTGEKTEKATSYAGEISERVLGIPEGKKIIWWMHKKNQEEGFYKK